jgi:hypothetical protein
MNYYNKEEDLVTLYKKCIKFTTKESFQYLQNLDIENLSVDEIVHIWNALSPKKRGIKNWENFIELSKNRMIELVGEEETKNLMGVIL